jgi:hypothetical protein
MKFSYSKLIFTSIILMGFNNFLFSQQELQQGAYFNDCFWVKGKNAISSICLDTINSNSVLLKKKQLNYNLVADFTKDSIPQIKKNIIKKNSTLFVVFKSQEDSLSNLLSIQRGIFKARLSNKKMICDSDVLLNFGNPKKGTLVSYLYIKNSLLGKKNGAIEFDDLLFNDTDNLNQLFELIYFPRFLNGIEKKIVESYLSIKYGVSLDEGQDYYNSIGNKIWDVTENVDFNNRISGIGKDDLTGLNQKQSVNTLETGLIIGCGAIAKSNIKNTVVLDDMDYILWGDNDKTTLLETSDDVSQKRIKRIWRVKTYSENGSTYEMQIKIDKSLMPIELNYNAQDTEFMWLAIDDSYSSDFNYSGARYIKATVNNENEIVFNGVNFFPNTESYFTIVKANEVPSNNNSTATGISSRSALKTKILNNGYEVFPIPVDCNEKFTIQFNLKESSNVFIQITDVNGKIIKNADLGMVDKYSFSESISVTGTYLIIVNINGIMETTKLIVK